MANEAYPCPCDIGHRIEYGGLGHEVQVEHIKAYLTKSPVDAGKAVVVIQDIFGWQLPNTRYMADMIAGNGYTYVWNSVFFFFFFGLNSCKFLYFVSFKGNKTKKPWLCSDIHYLFPYLTGKKKGSEVTQSCPTVCDPMDCSLPGSSVQGIFQARVLEWVAISSSKGIFPTQGSNPGLLHCRQMLYRLSHQGSP